MRIVRGQCIVCVLALGPPPLLRATTGQIHQGREERKRFDGS